MDRAIKIDNNGELRCWNCGSKNLETRRKAGGKLLGAGAGILLLGPLGAAGALAAKKRLRCQGCGSFNSTGKPEQWTGETGQQQAQRAADDRVAARAEVAAKRHAEQQTVRANLKADKERRKSRADRKARQAGQLKMGWYPDPNGVFGLLRYWDGEKWTDHVHSDPN